MPKSPKPVDIAHSRQRNLLSITWDDEVISELPVPYLRGWCPCAGCQGHGLEVRFQAPPDDVTATGLFEMGAYALGIRFSDGHDTGIFTWDWLRRISPESPPAGLKRGVFVGSEFTPAPE
jgi:DUF971 family protein